MATLRSSTRLTKAQSEFVLALRVFYQFGLDAKAPHLLIRISSSRSYYKEVLLKTQTPK